MSIYITGDCHGDYRKFNTTNFPEQKDLTRDDYVIVTGDFGIWDKSKEQKYWLEWLSKKTFTVLFVDGNHENFDLLNSYPVKTWNGGKVHVIKDNILHLMRGQVFEIDGHTFFTFGGARSHDITDGILDPKDSTYKEKKRTLNKMGKFLYRTNHVDWWEAEMPSEKEYKEGLKNLERCGWSVDYIISHCCPTKIQEKIAPKKEFNELTDYLDEVTDKVNFTGHYFGHYHSDRTIDKKYHCKYKDIERIL